MDLPRLGTAHAGDPPPPFPYFPPRAAKPLTHIDVRLGGGAPKHLGRSSTTHAVLDVRGTFFFLRALS